MENLNDLKAIWQSADTSALPESEEVVAMAKKHRRRKLFSTSLLVLAATVLTAAIVVVAVIYQSTMLSTRIGEICIILAGLILVATNITTINRFYKNRDLNNREFIVFLEHTRVRRHFYHTRTQVIALVLCWVGMLLYEYELLYRYNLVFIIIYALLIATMLVMWLIVRPRIYNKQAEKLNDLIEKIERISKQL